VFGLYAVWLDSLQPQGDKAELTRIFRRIFLQIMINLALVAGIFLVSAYFVDALSARIADWTADVQIQKALIWGAALLISLPFLVATYRKLQAFSMLLAEVGVKPEFAGAHTERTRRLISELIPVLAIAGIMLLIFALSSSILPPFNLLIVVLLGAAGLAVLLWRRLIMLHSRLQVALIETLDEMPDDK
jgi:CPA2 family monovalent cation:H+ antiporter-2